MTNERIWQIALEQSAIDCNCSPEDFRSGGRTVTRSRADPRARTYIPLPLKCDLVSYGSGIVAQTGQETEAAVRAYIEKYAPDYYCFETPRIYALDAALQPFGLQVCFMAQYYLPDLRLLTRYDCAYSLKLLEQRDFEKLYLPQWSNALCAQRRELDVLGVGAYDGDRLVGLAACSADCARMYQIGVDVLPQYRRRGIAAALTSRLTAEILKLDRVPFYCAAWCNQISARNAIKCGFRPAWVELTARETDFVKKIIG